jgi:LmbE family N-acetylglucosaminyl deacetylase
MTPRPARPRGTRRTPPLDSPLLRLGRASRRTVLCLGAHADDIEIGCGGTLLRLLERWPEVDVHWHVFSAPGARRREAERSAAAWLTGASRTTVRIGRFRESYFPDHWAAIKRAVERIRQSCDPDLVFTHWRDDRHQDHRVLSDLAWNAFRQHTILEFEIPKYDGDLGQPNVYVGLDEAVCRRKTELLMRHFPTQRTKHWFTPDTFMALLRLRGLECGPDAHYAEAFHGRKLVI